MVSAAKFAPVRFPQSRQIVIPPISTARPFDAVALAQADPLEVLASVKTPLAPTYGDSTVGWVESSRPTEPANGPFSVDWLFSANPNPLDPAFTGDHSAIPASVLNLKFVT